MLGRPLEGLSRVRTKVRRDENDRGQFVGVALRISNRPKSAHRDADNRNSPNAARSRWTDDISSKTLGDDLGVVVTEVGVDSDGINGDTPFSQVADEAARREVVFTVSASR